MVLNIPEASFPVTYLGVPLISTKLRSADCIILKERILRRIQSWSNKLLPFGGRMQLITLVLFSIQVYWSSIFILPSKILKDIESVLNAFVWKGVDLKFHGVKVAWSTVCLPKSEGGLGFKEIEGLECLFDASTPVGCMQERRHYMGKLDSFLCDKGTMPLVYETALSYFLDFKKTL